VVPVLCSHWDSFLVDSFGVKLFLDPVFVDFLDALVAEWPEGLVRDVASLFTFFAVGVDVAGFEELAFLACSWRVLDSG
jgi:hypothetical protein